AVTGELSLMPFILGFIILSWIAGLDIVYAFQDIEFDKKENLHSLPVRVGEKQALTWSLVCYILSTTAMVLAGFLSHMGIIYWIAVIVIVILFSYQQILARQKDINRSIQKMFQVNMYISPALFLGTLLDTWQGYFI
ncbi:MAG: UbiA family prenyltransferase, partial [Desulfobacula sp.]|nr:UbiA family prenyltransferase [Desulfobacula sp.]